MSESSGPLEPLELPEVNRITVGAMGEPGQRLFFLQARQGEELVTLKLEKIQVAALVAWIAKTLEDFPAPGSLPESLDPEPFTTPAFAVGSLGGGYDAASDRILLVATEANDDEGVEPSKAGEKPGSAEHSSHVARFGATREQMAALAMRGTELIASGRPPCPLCGYPLDPRGHQCPRTNGHRPPLL